MIERLLELGDISLIPSPVSNSKKGELNFGVKNMEGSISLPIFTSPNPAIIKETNWRVWEKAGIRTILPREENLATRLEGCQYIFSAFTINELQANFLRSKRQSQNQFKICVDFEIGGDIQVLNTCTELKKIYGNQVILMAGNICNPKTCLEYARAGIDYARVGMRNGESKAEEMGFYHPIVSLLIDIKNQKNTTPLGKDVKIIVEDTDIRKPVDILKCIALGADYVMLDEPLASLVEAAGSILKNEKTPQGGNNLEIINPGAYNLDSMSNDDLEDLDLRRYYRGSEYTHVTSTLETWSKELIECFRYAFVCTDATNWEEFKNHVSFRWV